MGSGRKLHKSMIAYSGKYRVKADKELHDRALDVVEPGMEWHRAEALLED